MRKIKNLMGRVSALVFAGVLLLSNVIPTYAADTSEMGYTYVYAGLTWAEYWESEGVYLSGTDLSASSDEKDSKGESDKGAFDAVSRATVNHGLHRGSFQCTTTIHAVSAMGAEKDFAVSTWEDNGATLVLTDGSKVSYSRGVITDGDTEYTLSSYEVEGIKYVPVAVKTSDYEEFKKNYSVVENGDTLVGGFSEQNLSAYIETADVTADTNGLKTAVKNEDGTFRFSARTTGSGSGLAGTALKTAEDIKVEVKQANGSYGEFLRVDLTGDGYGGLASGMYAVRWTYYGSDASRTTALVSYGTKFASDNWLHKAMGIQLGLTDSLRCQLPEGTDGTGYWALTVYAMGYSDYTAEFEVTSDNIVKSKDDETIDTSELEKLIAEAERLTEADYTDVTWKNVANELSEAKEELTAKRSQAAVNEAYTHLKGAIDALVKVQGSTGGSSDGTTGGSIGGNASGTTGGSTDDNVGTGTTVVAPTVNTGKSYTKGNLIYKVTSTKAGNRTVAVVGVKSKKLTSATIPASVKISGQSYKVTKIAKNAFKKCAKLKKLTIGKNVTTIGQNAFSGDSALKTITIESKVLKTVGSGAFKGINSKAKIKVASSKLKKYKKLLKGKGQGKKVIITKK
jgi:hypothetical protein